MLFSKQSILIFLIIATSLLPALKQPEQYPDVSRYPVQLSELGLFKQPLRDLSPATDVEPYTVNMPLFSDYAQKSRFFYLPPGKTISAKEREVFDFPVGSILVKNFYYTLDEQHPEAGKRILETRLLVHEEKGWVPLSYVWNDEQTDARIEVAGHSTNLEWTDQRGKKNKLNYQVPNLNQCKGCHSQNGQFVPIGPSLRQLSNPENKQLENWYEKGLLQVPETIDLTSFTGMPGLESTANTDRKARAYLDANCAHCHNRKGPASTSGLYLDYYETAPEHLGINKPPVAAGRGSGKRKFSIVPGKPNESILMYRMESNDTGIRMPEIGRQIAHKEGLELIKNWIKELE
jgi:uncharacterized repeat protein (TIGR03806 family)